MFQLFAGPELPRRSSTSTRRRSAVRSSRRTGRSCTGAGATSSRIGAPAMLDGAPVNAELADDVLMYDALGIPPGVYLFDRPVLAGEYGFARWAWDEDAAAEPRRDARRRSRGAAITSMIWSSTWACGSTPGDNGVEAQALGYLAPGPVGPPALRRRRRHELHPRRRPIRRRRRGGATRSRPSSRANGIQGIKLDRGEEHIPSEATDVWADGRTGREVRNDYPTLQAKIHHDALASVFPDGDFVLVSRPAYTGTQQWSIVLGRRHPRQRELRRRPGHRPRAAQRDHQPAARRLHGLPDLGLRHRRLLRVQGPRGVRALDRVQRVLRHHGDRRQRHARAVGHADRARVRHGDDRHLPPLHARCASRSSPTSSRRRAEASAGMPIVRPMPFADRKDRKLDGSVGPVSLRTRSARRAGVEGRASGAATCTSRAGSGAATGTRRRCSRAGAR